MSLNKILLATLAGTVVFFLLGWVVWGMLLADFMAKNASAGTMKPESEMIWWAMIVSNAAAAFLLAYIFGKWASISAFMPGLKAGALITFFIALSVDMYLYAGTNLTTLNGALVDIVAWTAVGAVTGGVIGLVLGWGKSNS